MQHCQPTVWFFLLLVTASSCWADAEKSKSLSSSNENGLRSAGPFGDVLGNLVNNIACRATNSFGRTGRCVPRSCCSSQLSVDALCVDSRYTCCYGVDLCLERDYDRDYDYRPNQHVLKPDRFYRKLYFYSSSS